MSGCWGEAEEARLNMPTRSPRKPPSLWETAKALAWVLYLRFRLWFILRGSRRAWLYLMAGAILAGVVAAWFTADMLPRL
jgi:hypothetical protein